MGWLLFFLVLCGIDAAIAYKKGRSALAFFFGPAVAGFLIALLVSYAMGNAGNAEKSDAMQIAAFLCPIVGFVMVLMMKNRDQMAAEFGEFGGYKKCPFCAESVKVEATKCRHCQSDLTAPNAKS